MQNVLHILTVLMLVCSLSFHKTVVSENTSPDALTKNKQTNNIFSSEYIDDIGVRNAINNNYGQVLDQTFYDKKLDITVHFERIMTDDKETKLLLTYQSNKINLKNYYIDLFEGHSSINLIIDNQQEISLDDVGWGSRYYDSKENKVVEALSFDSLKKYKGKNMRLEIENLTIYEGKTTNYEETLWELEFNLDNTAILERESVDINQEFNFKGQTYKIVRMEFSPLETRIILKGSDILSGKYDTMSQLEYQFLTARKIDENYGYIVDNSKPGVFLISNGNKVDPIFSKNEVPSNIDEFILVYGPVKQRQDLKLQVGDSAKIALDIDKPQN